jgi:uncharacterized membrane protein YGL010W
MAFYAAYHQDPRNKATHFVGVPLIMLALLVPLGWIRMELLGFEVTAAMLLAAAVLAYYFVLDVPLAARGAAQGWTWFGALFVGGWILQLVGHAFEGRKPALADNLFQIFVAPVFLAAELFFALGWKPELHRAVERRAIELRNSP